MFKKLREFNGVPLPTFYLVDSESSDPRKDLKDKKSDTTSEHTGKRKL